MFKNGISAATERRKEKGKRSHKKDLILKRGKREEGEGRVHLYVLYCMVATFPTCQVERSPLKAPAPLNTAPHSNKEKSNETRKKLG